MGLTFLNESEAQTSPRCFVTGLLSTDPGLRFIGREPLFPPFTPSPARFDDLNVYVGYIGSWQDMGFSALWLSHN